MPGNNAKLAAQAASDAASQIRSLVAERDELRAKVAQYERNEQVAKLAKKMVERGVLEEGQTLDDVQAHLSKVASEQPNKLAAIEESLELVGPNLWSKLASLDNDRREGGGANDLVNYLLRNKE